MESFRKMSELDFAKVINEVKAVQAKAVSREKYEQSENEVQKLKSMLREADERALNHRDQLKKLKLENESLKLEHQKKMDVIKARDERTQKTIKSWNIKKILLFHP